MKTHLTLFASLFISFQAAAQPDFYSEVTLPGNTPTGPNLLLEDLNGDQVFEVIFIEDNDLFIGKRDDNNFAFTSTSIGFPTFLSPPHDHNGDGIMDIILCNETHGTNKGVYVVLVDMDLCTSPPVKIRNTPTIKSVFQDLNGDNTVDIIYGNYIEGKLLIEKSQPLGMFQTIVVDENIVGLMDFQLFDVDKDGDLDIVTINNVVGQVNVYLNDGQCNFSKSTVDILNLPVKISIEDFNNDGYLDLLIDDNSNEVSIFENKQDGTFTNNAFDLAKGVDTWSHASGDFDQNGTVDILSIGAGNNVAHILQNDGTGTFTNTQSLSTVGNDPGFGVFGDDAFAQSGEFFIAVNNNLERITGFSPWAMHNIDAPGPGPHAILGTFTLSNLNFLATVANGNIVIYQNENTNPGTWLNNTITNTLGALDIQNAEFADINTDGSPDVIFSDPNQGVLMSEGNPMMVPYGALMVLDDDPAQKVHYGHIQPGVPGLFVLTPNDEVKLKAIVNGNTVNVQSLDTEANALDFALADEDGNGVDDPLILSEAKVERILIDDMGGTSPTTLELFSPPITGGTIFQDSPGEFGISQPLPAFFSNPNKSVMYTKNIISTNHPDTYNVSLGDIDNDGDTDAVAASTSTNRISWFENIDGFDFAERIIVTEYSDPTSVFLMDVDFDGDLDVVAASEGNNTFDWFENPLLDNTVPVAFIEFNAHKAGETARLTWSTAVETNNKGFDIQRSRDNLRWTSIGFVNGRGTTPDISKYTFTDDHPYSGINYYRLNQIDFDGRSRLSDTKALRFDKTKRPVTIYPNPVRDQLNVLLPTDAAIKSTKIIDVTGKNFKAKYLPGNMLDVSFLDQGTYVMEVVLTTGERVVLSFIKIQ